MKHQKPNNQLHIESRALTARNQLIDALSIFGSVGQFIMRANSEDFVQQTGGKLDGGVKEAVETTMINACNRLDAMLADESRWTLQERDSLEEKIRKSYEASADLFEKQRALAAEANTPHHRYPPMLFRLRPGLWMAIKGSMENIDGSIVGLGESPQAAVECYDANFQGKLSKEQLDYIQSLSYETKVMVNRRIREAQNLPGSGNADAGDSREAGQKHPLGGAGNPNPPHSPGASSDYPDPNDPRNAAPDEPPVDDKHGYNGDLTD